MEVVTTWRVTRPVNMDAVCLQVIKYEWNENEQHSFILLLHPEPHWQEYPEGSMIQSTLDFTGRDMIYLFGRGHNWPNEFDPREALEKVIDERLQRIVSDVMELRPPVEGEP